MKAFSYGIYNSKAWKDLRQYVIAREDGLCQHCKKRGRTVAGVICHHIEPITEANCNDVNITLNADNIKLLCFDCHEELHAAIDKGNANRLVAWDANGQPVKL